MIDGNLRVLFQKYLKGFHWQAIETGGTGRGIPDLNGCVNGREFWIEMKQTLSHRVKIRPEQVGWIERRSRTGGRVYIAARRTNGKKRLDDLYLLPAASARSLSDGLRLTELPASLILGYWSGGPSSWDWETIASILER